METVDMVIARMLLGVAAIALCSVAAVAGGPRYLTSVRGPYTGRVVDAATGKPVPRALVLIVWQSEDDEVDGMKNLVGIREAATGPDGRFAVQTPFEASVPPRTLPPAVYAFAHGYLPFPENPYSAGAAGEEFRGSGRLISLSPASTDNDRARAFNVLFTLLAAGPDEALRPALRLSHPCCCSRPSSARNWRVTGFASKAVSGGR